MYVLWSCGAGHVDLITKKTWQTAGKAFLTFMSLFCFMFPLYDLQCKSETYILKSQIFQNCQINWMHDMTVMGSGVKREGYSAGCNSANSPLDATINYTLHLERFRVGHLTPQPQLTSASIWHREDPQLHRLPLQLEQLSQDYGPLLWSEGEDKEMQDGHTV